MIQLTKLRTDPALLRQIKEALPLTAKQLKQQRARWAYGQNKMRAEVQRHLNKE